MNIKKTTFLCTVFACTATTLSTGAANVVTIKGQEIMQKSEKGKKVQKELKEQQEKLVKSLQKKQTEIQKAAKEFEDNKKKFDKEVEDVTNNKLLSQSAKEEQFQKLQEKARKLEEEKAKLDVLVKHFEQDRNETNNKVSKMYEEKMGEFQNTIAETIKEVAQKENWDVVLMEESVAYANPKTSKTNDIISALNTKEKLNKSSIKNDVKEIEKNIFG